MADIFDLLISNVNGWDSLSKEHISIQPIIGGLSNKLYKAEIPLEIIKQCQINSPHKNRRQIPSKVLIRIFGGSHKDSTQSLIERREESRIFHLLASQKLAPQIYHEFNDGRFEEFVAGRNPSFEEFSSTPLQKQIAKNVAKFHKVKGIYPQPPSTEFNKIPKNSFQTHIKEFLSVVLYRNTLTNCLKNTQHFQNCLKNTQNIQNLPQNDQNLPQNDQNLPQSDQNLYQNDQNLPQNNQNLPQNDQNSTKPQKIILHHSLSLSSHLNSQSYTTTDRSKISLPILLKNGGVELPQEKPERIREFIKDDIAFYRHRKNLVPLINLTSCPSPSELQSEVDWLLAEISLCGGFEFCHNDLQRGNVMVENFGEMFNKEICVRMGNKDTYKGDIKNFDNNGQKIKNLEKSENKIDENGEKNSNFEKTENKILKNGEKNLKNKGNKLKVKKMKKYKNVRLIDFEYAGWNYRAFEFGNFFCECYIDNFSENGKFEIRQDFFPSDKKIKKFLAHYLIEKRKIELSRINLQLKQIELHNMFNDKLNNELNKNDNELKKNLNKLTNVNLIENAEKINGGIKNCTNKLNNKLENQQNQLKTPIENQEKLSQPRKENNITNNHINNSNYKQKLTFELTPELKPELYYKKSEKKKLVNETELNEFLKEVKIGIICSHMYWALWALIQDAVADIKWCYHEYAVARFNEYYRLKNEHLKSKKS